MSERESERAQGGTHCEQTSTPFLLPKTFPDLISDALTRTGRIYYSLARWGGAGGVAARGVGAEEVWK